ncbi:MAG: DUF1800 domain-containing protein [Solirubrobacterales bacterium]|nr:DUF1800 domain-containing protein [Solirubrobacterales bacterium]
MTSGLSRRDALALATRTSRRSARGAGLPPTPAHLHATLVTPALVGIAWSNVHPRPRHLVYDVFRDGRLIARAQREPLFSDHDVEPRRRYRYRVRARVGRVDGQRSRPLTVQTPPAPLPKATPPAGSSAAALAAASPGASSPSPSPGPGPSPAPSPTPAAILSSAMVDRMFWRAGFGPSEADRRQWSGQPVSALVDHFLTAPYELAPTSTPPTYKGNPIDPLASDPELQMEWLDRMQRVANPLAERLNFFWHRHWAVSRDSGIPSSMLLAYRDRLRRYSDLAGNPTARFHDLALEMTTEDAAMSLYLTGYLNVKSAPNENYGREFMELFTLGVTNAEGTPNYTQTDVHELARAFTGYSLNEETGVVSFDAAHHDTATKTILGQTGTFDAPGGVALVLSQPNHAPFIVRELWGEFIPAPIPADALSSLTSTYLANDTQLAPVIRGILTHPLIFDSLEEPTMIKPPVVYTVGMLRTLAAPLRDSVQTDSLGAMEQQPYHPPNVAGWEGGLSWMSTGTSVARFEAFVRCQALLGEVVDVPGEGAQAAYERAHAAVGAPWLSEHTATALRAYASKAPAASAAQRRERQYALMTFMLGGPDGQVM